MKAAADMGQLRTALRAHLHAGDGSPSGTVEQLDRSLEPLGIDALATLVVARVDGDRVRWSNAGHPPPLLVDPSGEVRWLETEISPLVGLVPDLERPEGEATMGSGSTLLFFTDGLVERRGEDIDDGLERAGPLGERPARLRRRRPGRRDPRRHARGPARGRRRAARRTPRLTVARPRLADVTYVGRVAAVAAAAALLLSSCRGEVDPDWVEADAPRARRPSRPARGARRGALRGRLVGRRRGRAAPADRDPGRPARGLALHGRHTWEALPVTATTYWGRRAILTGVACSGEEVVAIGARSGGAHGNPRVTTFFESDGGLDDQRAPFNLYGGATATNVGPLTGAAPGWLITGNRTSGPAVWHSTDGRDFTIEEDVPGPGRRGRLHLARPGGRLGRRAVGGRRRRQRHRHARPRTGRVDLPRRPHLDAGRGARDRRLRRPRAGGGHRRRARRARPARRRLRRMAARGRRLGAWPSDFGALPADATRSPFVASLVTGAGGLWATTSDGAAYALWHSEDGDEWAPVGLPAHARP